MNSPAGRAALHRPAVTRQLASVVSDSVWHKELTGVDQSHETSPYWLVPFQNYKAMCPYLVGTYDEVGAELAHVEGGVVEELTLNHP